MTDKQACKAQNVAAWADGTQTIWECHRTAGHDGPHEDTYDDGAHHWHWH